MRSSYPAIRPEDAFELPNMTLVEESRPDAVTELVRILRDQLNTKDERIRFLERQLVDSNARIADQQKLLTRLLERATGAAEPVAMSTEVAAALFSTGASAISAGTPGPAPARRVKNRSPEADAHGMSTAIPVEVRSDPPKPPAPQVASGPPVIRMSDLGLGKVQIQEIASAVLSAAPRSAERTESAASAPSAAARRKAAEVNPPVSRVPHVIGEFEPTWRFERNELERGHRAMAAAGRRGIWPFRRRPSR